MLGLRNFAPKPPAETPRAFLPRNVLGVGDAIAGAANPYVLKIGDTMTGSLLSGTDGLKLGSTTSRWDLHARNVLEASSNVRLALGTGTNIHRATVADGAAAVAHQLGSLNALVTSGADLLQIYSDNFSTLKLKVNRLGTVLPGSDNVQEFGNASLTWATVHARLIRSNTTNNRIGLAASDANRYLGEMADGASALGHVLDTSASFVTGGAKLLSIRNAGSEVMYVNRLGSPAPVSDNTVDNGGQSNRWASLFATSWKDGNGVFRVLIGNSTFNDYRAAVANGAGAIAHKLRNAISLTAGTDRFAVRIYQDDGTTGILDVASNGSLQSSTFTGRGTIADGAAAVGNVLDTLNTFSTAGAKLQSIRNGGTEKRYFDKDGVDGTPGTNTHTSNVANGAGAVGHVLDTVNALSNATAQLLSVRSAGTEYLSIAASDAGLYSVGDAAQFQGAAGTTEDFYGRLTQRVEKFHVDYAAFTAAAPSQDLFVLSLPAATRIVGCYARTTIAFAGLAGTIQASVGDIPNGGAIGSSDELILAHNVKVTGSKGLVDGDLGVHLARATAVQGGNLQSLTLTTKVYVRLTSGAGNLGDGVTTTLTSGQLQVWLITEALA